MFQWRWKHKLTINFNTLNSRFEFSKNYLLASQKLLKLFIISQTSFVTSHTRIYIFSHISLTFEIKVFVSGIFSSSRCSLASFLKGSHFWMYTASFQPRKLGYFLLEGPLFRFDTFSTTHLFQLRLIFWVFRKAGSKRGIFR